MSVQLVTANPNLPLSQEIQNKYQSLNITKGYLENIGRKECNFKSIAAKISILIFPILILITLFVDLLSALANCLYGKKEVVVLPAVPPVIADPTSVASVVPSQNSADVAVIPPTVSSPVVDPATVTSALSPQNSVNVVQSTPFAQNTRASTARIEQAARRVVPSKKIFTTPVSSPQILPANSRLLPPDWFLQAAYKQDGIEGVQQITAARARQNQTTPPELLSTSIEELLSLESIAASKSPLPAWFTAKVKEIESNANKFAATAADLIAEEQKTTAQESKSSTQDEFASIVDGVIISDSETIPNEESLGYTPYTYGFLALLNEAQIEAKEYYAAHPNAPTTAEKQEATEKRSPSSKRVHFESSPTSIPSPNQYAALQTDSDSDHDSVHSDGLIPEALATAPLTNEPKISALLPTEESLAPLADCHPARTTLPSQAQDNSTHEPNPTVQASENVHDPVSTAESAKHPDLQIPVENLSLNVESLSTTSLTRSVSGNSDTPPTFHEEPQ